MKVSPYHTAQLKTGATRPALFSTCQIGIEAYSFGQTMGSPNAMNSQGLIFNMESKMFLMKINQALLTLDNSSTTVTDCFNSLSLKAFVENQPIFRGIELRIKPLSEESNSSILTANNLG